MLGAIIGDAAGSCYEFHNVRTKDFPIFEKGSEYTDDSVLTMAVAKWILDDPEFTHESCVDHLVDFGHRYPDPKGEYGGGFYHWLFSPDSLMNYDSANKTLGRKPYNSFGNGSAMRASATGWACDTLEETERVAKISAEITHNHPEGIKGAQATAAAIFMARTGKSKAEIKNYISSKYGYDLNRTCDEIRPHYYFDGSCQGTVPEAIVAFLDSTDFEDAIRNAVSLGGDSDTLTCITGGIAEAFYKKIPAKMRADILAMIPMEFVDILDGFGKFGYKY